MTRQPPSATGLLEELRAAQSNCESLHTQLSKWVALCALLCQALPLLRARDCCSLRGTTRTHGQLSGGGCSTEQERDTASTKFTQLQSELDSILAERDAAQEVAQASRKKVVLFQEKLQKVLKCLPPAKDSEWPPGRFVSRCTEASHSLAIGDSPQGARFTLLT